MDRAQDFLKSSRPAQTRPSCMHFKPSSSITRCSHCILAQQVKKLRLHHVPPETTLTSCPSKRQVDFKVALLAFEVPYGVGPSGMGMFAQGSPAEERCLRSIQRLPWSA